MRCYRVRRLIEDYHDGELAQEEAVGIAAHLRDCASCRDELSALERESAACAAYAEKIDSLLDIPAGLWDEVARRDAAAHPTDRKASVPQPVRNWIETLIFRPWVRQAVAAAVLVTVSVTATVLVLRHNDRAMEAPVAQQGAQAPAGAGDRSLEAALQSVHRAEQEYLNAIQMLTTVYREQESRLDPRLAAELQANLEQIDRNIAATREAYYEHPRDPELALYMLAAYSRKVELLQDLTS